MHRLVRRFVYLGLAVLLTLVIGTIGFTTIENYPPFDAFYMTLTTMTTVGYGEVHPLSRNGRIFNSFLIFFGVSTMFFAIGAMTQTIIEVEFGEFFGKRRNKRMIEKLENHFIICGYGRVGRGAAAEMQRAGVPFVIIDHEPERVERAIRGGMLAVLADATRDETLRDVRIQDARGLISALASDADNLFVILSARTLNNKLYLATRAGEEGAEEKLRRAGADAVIAPYALAGYRLAQSMVMPHVAQFLDFTTSSLGPNVGIVQMPVTPDCEFASRSLQQMQIRRDLGVIVLAIRKGDGEMLFNPPADTVISGGDYLIVMGEQESLRRLEGLLGSGDGAKR